MQVPSVVLTDEIKISIVKLVQVNPEEEVCGFVLDNGLVFGAPNKAEDPTESFIIPQASVTAAKKKGSIAAIFHSHPKDSQASHLSFEDVAAAQRTNTPYILYHPQDNVWDYYDPQHPSPFPLRHSGDPTSIGFYTGWVFVRGRSDCYALLKNFYTWKLGISLPHVEIGKDWREMLAPGWSQYEDGLKANGFVRLPSDAPLKLWDVPLMTFRGNNPHHTGILVDIEQGTMLHLDEPPYLSRRDLFAGTEWSRLSHKGGVWRHPALHQP